MNIPCEITEESSFRLAEHFQIPIRFEVRSIYEIEGDDPASAILTETHIAKPWIKDYDTIETVRLTDGVLLAAYTSQRRIGGCVLIAQDETLVIWDLRVHPDDRRHGIGRELFQSAVNWAKDRNYGQLTVETQNINVPACRFYQRMGCRLISINLDAYEEFPEEVQLVWGLDF